MRYAVYYAPEDGAALAEFGARWLGRDAKGKAAEPRALDGFEADELTALTAAPRRYGFHGTLKPPFALAPGRSLESLLASLRHFAGMRMTFDIPRLRLARIGEFFALVPSGPSPALDHLAADCVRAFDRWRLPSPPEELHRRRQAGLTPRQDALLQRWGYPYVLDEFRFHLTLTARVDDATALRLEPMLEALAAPLCRAPLCVSSLCLFAECAPGGELRLISRANLAPR